MTKLAAARNSLALLVATALLSTGADKPDDEAKLGPGSRPWEGRYIYGRELTSRPERRAFWAEMGRLTDYADQLALWRRHTAKMRQRAKDRGLILEEPPEVMPPVEVKRLRRPIYGLFLMTTEEVERYRAKERDLTPEQREVFLAQHARWMKRRAWLRGIPLKPTKAETDAMEKAEKGESPEPESPEP